MATDQGILIAVEGIDGAGKTTQVQLLAEALRSAGEGVTVSKEPTDGHWGRKIKESASNGRLPIEEELHILTEDRKQHVQEVIRPALKEGDIVILDRYFYSTLAYQGARGVDVEEIDKQMRDFAPIPDMVLLLDVEPRKGIFRISEDRGETPNHFEGAEDLSKVRELFNRLSRVKDEIWKIDGSLSIEEVHATIISLFIQNSFKEKRCAKSYGCDDIYHCGPRLNGNCQWFNVASKLLPNGGSNLSGVISKPVTNESGP